LSDPPTLRIPVSVVVERHRAESPWLDVIYRAVSVLPGVPAASPWTALHSTDDVTTFYAGEAVVELHRTETVHYRDNIASGKPSLWVVMRPESTAARLALLLVTADPAEGEALTGAGNDLVEAVPMPTSIIQTVAGFIAQYPPQETFYKRERDRSGSAPRDAGSALKGEAGKRE
jgi:hypothetical protein